MEGRWKGGIREIALIHVTLARDYDCHVKNKGQEREMGSWRKRTWLGEEQNEYNLSSNTWKQKRGKALVHIRVVRTISYKIISRDSCSQHSVKAFSAVLSNTNWPVGYYFLPYLKSFNLFTALFSKNLQFFPQWTLCYCYLFPTATLMLLSAFLTFIYPLDQF